MRLLITSLLLVIISKCYGENMNKLFVISSLRTANSFIYQSGTPLFISETKSDIWRICPKSMPTDSCYPHIIKTDQCTALSQTCRCYNWIFRDTANVRGSDNNCIYVQLHLPAKNLTLRWELDYTYPVLPQGYETFLQILNTRFLSNNLNFNDYKTILTPLLCEQASKQNILFPAFDNCEFNYILNIQYKPMTETVIIKSDSVGKIVISVISSSLILSYMYFFLRHPTI